MSKESNENVIYCEFCDTNVIYEESLNHMYRNHAKEILERFGVKQYDFKQYSDGTH
jgi:ABC-type molybdenum transport system ATPase subunit/photorepair protein PhrA